MGAMAEVAKVVKDNNKTIASINTNLIFVFIILIFLTGLAELAHTSAPEARPYECSEARPAVIQLLPILLDFLVCQCHTYCSLLHNMQKVEAELFL